MYKCIYIHEYIHICVYIQVFLSDYLVLSKTSSFVWSTNSVQTHLPYTLKSVLSVLQRTGLKTGHQETPLMTSIHSDNSPQHYVLSPCLSFSEIFDLLTSGLVFHVLILSGLWDRNFLDQMLVPHSTRYADDVICLALFLLSLHIKIYIYSLTRNRSNFSSKYLVQAYFILNVYPIL